MDGYVTTTQAAHLLGVHRSTVHRWVASGALPSVQTALGVLIAPDALDRVESGRGGIPPLKRRAPRGRRGAQEEGAFIE